MTVCLGLSVCLPVSVSVSELRSHPPLNTGFRKEFSHKIRGEIWGVGIHSEFGNLNAAIGTLVYLVSSFFIFGLINYLGLMTEKI